MLRRARRSPCSRSASSGNSTSTCCLMITSSLRSTRLRSSRRRPTSLPTIPATRGAWIESRRSALLGDLLEGARIVQCPDQPGSPLRSIDPTWHRPAISVRPATVDAALRSSQRAAPIEIERQMPPLIASGPESYGVNRLTKPTRDRRSCAPNHSLFRQSVGELAQLRAFDGERHDGSFLERAVF
jgi:hypothetical protein